MVWYINQVNRGLKIMKKMLTIKLSDFFPIFYDYNRLILE